MQEAARLWSDRAGREPHHTGNRAKQVQVRADRGLHVANDSSNQIRPNRVSEKPRR